MRGKKIKNMIFKIRKFREIISDYKFHDFFFLTKNSPSELEECDKER